MLCRMSCVLKKMTSPESPSSNPFETDFPKDDFLEVLTYIRTLSETNSLGDLLDQINDSPLEVSEKSDCLAAINRLMAKEILVINTKLLKEDSLGSVKKAEAHFHRAKSLLSLASQPDGVEDSFGENPHFLYHLAFLDFLAIMNDNRTIGSEGQLIRKMTKKELNHLSSTAPLIIHTFSSARQLILCLDKDNRDNFRKWGLNEVFDDIEKQEFPKSLKDVDDFVEKNLRFEKSEEAAEDKPKPVIDPVKPRVEPVVKSVQGNVLRVLVIADVQYEGGNWGEKDIDLILGLGDMSAEVLLRASDALGCRKIFAVKGNHDHFDRFPMPIVDLHMMTEQFRGLVFSGFQGA